MTSNVEVLKNPIKRNRIAKILKIEKEDLICLQETHAVMQFYFVQNPSQYLPSLNRILNAYANISGYKVNEDKSSIKDLTISARERKASFPNEQSHLEV